MGKGEPVLLHVETRVHGRVLLSGPPAGVFAGLLVGFHGYAENAQTQFDRLIPVAAPDWMVCSIQALHPFYTRTDGEVVANWMTRLDRELAIAENLDYVAEVLRRIAGRLAPDSSLSFCGFSQGTAMAYRAAVARPPATATVVAVGGDVPPELGREHLERLRQVLVARGARDRHYPEERMEEDLRRLAAAGIPARSFVYDGAHQWQDGLTPEIRRFLAGHR
jgi:predicted esterase